MQSSTAFTRALLLSITLTATAVSDPLRAQAIGDRVRMYTQDTVVVGDVLQLSDDGFVFANDDLRQSFAYRDLERLEISGGIGSRWLWGSIIGTLAGTFVGGRLAGEVEQVVTDTSWRPSYGISDAKFLPCVLGGFFLTPGWCWERRESTVVRTRKDQVPGLVGGVLAGVVGGVLGFRMKHETWQPFLLPQDTVTVGFADEPIFVGRDRLRVSADGRQLIGELAGVTDEGFEFTDGEVRRTLAYRDIDSLERSVGMRTRWKTGLGLGLLGGFVAFPTFNDAWGCVAEDWRSPSCKDKGTGMLAWMGRGALLGLGTSILMRRESWESIPLRDDAVGLNPIFTPHRGPDGRYGLLLGMRIEF